MSFPNNIIKEHLLKAIEKIDNEGIPADAQSSYYDVVFNNKLYPPKVVVSFANIFANGKELDRNSFAGGLNTPCFKLLEQNGFTIEQKRKSKELIKSELELLAILSQYNKVDVLNYFEIIDQIVIKLKVDENDNRLVFSCRDEQRITLIIGQRYIFDLRLNNNIYGFISRNKTNIPVQEKFNGKEDVFYNRTNKKESIIIEEIIAGALNELNRTKKSGFLKNDSISLRTACFDKEYRDSLLNKLNTYEMTEQVMIYEVKSAAASNAKELFSNDSKHFYWNETKFRNLKLGDFIFVVNRNDRWVLFSRLDKIDIPTTDGGDTTIFSDKGKVFNVSGKWNKFIRLEILNTLAIPDDWQWQSLGSSETTYLNGSRIGLDSSENRIKNINQLRQLTEDETISQILENCRLNFNGSKAKPKPIKLISNQKHNIKNEVNILTAIKTKPFILLAGISGTGKSRLVRTLAFKTCNKDELRRDLKKPGNFEMIPVRPNWHDSSELMGYVSRINGEKYITTTFLKFIAKAWKHKDVPFFLCLDEMNLAPVEQYFAEYLSIIETRQVINGELDTDYIVSKNSFENHNLYSQLLIDLELEGSVFSEGISIPSNLVVIGTVNMDETTHTFSRKVLDRAMTFEMNNVNLSAGLDLQNNDWSYPESFIPKNDVIGEYTTGAEVYSLNFEKKNNVIRFLEDINAVLEGTPFKIAYRVRDEFLIYCYYASLNQTNDDWFINALDEMTSMKILSRIEGDEAKTGNVLRNLQQYITDKFKKSNAKIKDMENRLQLNGYTSFWS